MRFSVTASCAAVLLTISAATWATDAPVNTPPKETAAKFDDLAPFPAAKSIRQSAVVAGKRLDYQVTVGAIGLKDDKGKLLGEVVYTAYIVPGSGAVRPVTFAFNGGPGAASAYLNLGAIGPKKINMGLEDDNPSDPPIPHDNPNSWLDFTDLVFIDPIDTGYSRSRVDEEQAKKAFMTTKSDTEYLSRVVYDWLLQNDRMASRKYLVGESYGGSRAPRMAYYLQNTLGVGVSGIVLLSPALDMPMHGNDVLSTTFAMVSLPAMAAGYIERQGKPLNETVMGPIEFYARTEFVADLLAGPADKAATDRLSAKVAELTGLDPVLVRRLNGRVDPRIFLRESRRAEGKIGSIYDSNVTTYDPFPDQVEPNYDDPMFTRPTAVFVSAITGFIANQVGWKVDARYYLNNFDLHRKFEQDDKDSPVTALRKALAADPKMSAIVVNGWNDFACPYFVSKLILAQLPSYGVTERVKLHVYPGGHQFYTRPESAAAFRRDVKEAYGPAS